MSGGLTLSGDTSGSVKLVVPAVAGTNTITVPAVTATVLTTASSGQVIPKAALPTGSVLQVVNATYSTQTSTNSSSKVATGLTATITPTSASSKILIIVTHGDMASETPASSGCVIELWKNGSTKLSTNTNQGYYNTTGGSNNIGPGTAINYLDSPATTSATTYATYFHNTGASVNVVVQRDGTVSSITLLEIAA